MNSPDLVVAAQQALEAWDTRAGIDTASRAFEALRAALEKHTEPVRFLFQGNEFWGAPPAPYATWDDALASMFTAGTVQGLRISALPQQAEQTKSKENV